MSAAPAALPAPVPPVRRVPLNDRPAVASRDVVLYWQVAARRTTHNPALQHAVRAARAWGKPLVVLEALRAGYPWASDRLHRFALDGMHDTAAAYARAGVAHLAYVEPAPGAGRGLLETLAARACVVITDDAPGGFLPRMLAAAGRKLAAVGTLLEAVDGNGLLPLRAMDRAWPSAAHFRRALQRALPAHLADAPEPAPLAHAAALPRAEGAEAPPRVARWLADVRARWPMADPALLAGTGPEAARLLAALPIDHGVPPVPGARGGEREGARVLARFLAERLARYGTARNAPEVEAASGLSPWLHWGHVSVHAVLAALAAREGWDPTRLAPRPTGTREGWWGMSPDAEAFLDELVTWRELAHGTALHLPGHDAYASLPGWARATLDAHAADPREHLYDADALAAGDTHDPLWNAAQGELRGAGRIHNYLRMLWGKKVVEWTRAPDEAMALLLALNDRWALDGRDANSVAGVAWTLGRYDRPWFPERPVFGTVRWMSSANTARKVRVRDYVARWGGVRAPAGGSVAPGAGTKNGTPLRR